MTKLVSPVLCDVLQHELDRGNEVVEEERGWSRIRIALRMRDPIDTAYAKRAASRSASARFFETSDPHYRNESAGILDGQEALAGPKP